MLLYCLVVCSTACFCIGTWFIRWFIAVAAATTNAAAAAECTIRNRKTGDLSLIIRFTFYAFQMINANVFSPSFALVHAGTKNLTTKGWHKICHVNFLDMRMDKHVENITVETCMCMCVCTLTHTPLMWLYNFRFIYIHH